MDCWDIVWSCFESLYYIKKIFFLNDAFKELQNRFFAAWKLSTNCQTPIQQTLSLSLSFSLSHPVLKKTLWHKEKAPGSITPDLFSPDKCLPYIRVYNHRSFQRGRARSLLFSHFKDSARAREWERESERERERGGGTILAPGLDLYNVYFHSMFRDLAKALK